MDELNATDSSNFCQETVFLCKYAILSYSVEETASPTRIQYPCPLQADLTSSTLLGHRYIINQNTTSCPTDSFISDCRRRCRVRLGLCRSEEIIFFRLCFHYSLNTFGDEVNILECRWDCHQPSWLVSGPRFSLLSLMPVIMFSSINKRRVNRYLEGTRCPKNWDGLEMR